MKKMFTILLIISSFAVSAHDDGLTCHEHPHTHEPDHPPIDDPIIVVSGDGDCFMSYEFGGYVCCPTCLDLMIDDLVAEPVSQRACSTRGDNESGPRR